MVQATAARLTGTDEPAEGFALENLPHANQA
jgi:hypothetical protein